MYSIDSNMLDALSQYLHMINNYSMFFYIAVSVLIYSTIIYGRYDKIRNIIVGIINMLIVIIIINYYGLGIINNLDTFINLDFINNIYIYFTLTIVSLILLTHVFLDRIVYSIIKRIFMILYVFILINILFALYMTAYLDNNFLLVLGNIYPMVKLGNILSIAFYAFYIYYYINTKRRS